MMFSADDDDNDFIGSTSGTKLASLFGTDQDVDLQDGNQSLVYRPPKQSSQAAKKPPASAPATGSTSGSTNTNSTAQQHGSMSVIHAGVVHAYKFENGTHVSQGKLGVAVVGNHDNHLYRLLLYRGKQQAVATAYITTDFAYTVQSNNYASFYDEKRQSWSIMFDAQQAAIDCAKQVGLARVNSRDQMLESVLTQDVAFGKGPSVNSGDTIAVKFNISALVNRTLGPAFDETKTFIKMKPGTSDVMKGLSTGLIGANIGGMRLLFVPRSQTDQTANPNIPMNSVLVYTVIVEVWEEPSTATHPVSATKEIENKPPLSSKPSSATLGEEATVRARGASISEQLQLSPKTDKAKIISRMAKMGQPMLPLQGAVAARVTKGRNSAAAATASSESDEEAFRAASGGHSSPSPEPVIPPRPRARNQQSNSNAKRAWELQQQQQQQHQQGITNSLIQHLPIPYGMTGQPQLLPLTTAAGASSPYMILPNQACVASPSDSHVPVLLSEVRSQTTELRLQMGHVSEMMGRVLGKLEQSQNQQQQHSYPTMEVGMLTQNIQRIVKENEDLRTELKEKNLKLESQTTTITELLHRNQKFLEQSNSMWEQRSTYMESSSLTNQVKQTLEAELQQARSALLDLETQLLTFRERKRSMEVQTSEVRSKELRNLRKDLADARQELTSKGDSMSAVETERDQLKDELVHLKQELQELNIDKIEFSDLKQKYEELLKKSEEEKATVSSASSVQEQQSSSSTLMLSGEIKKIMNAVYRKLNKNFNMDQSYNGDEIRDILASTIRLITLELMDHLDKGEEPVEPTVLVEPKERPEEKVVVEDEKSTEKSVDESQDGEATFENQDWKPQPPPFLESNTEEEENDWFS